MASSECLTLTDVIFFLFHRNDISQNNSTMSEQTSFTEKLISGLHKAANELEELRLQASLGKAEAKDAIEEAGKRFNNYMHAAGVEFDEAKSKVKEKANEWKSELEELRVQFALGKAEAKDAVDEQMKRIRVAMQEIESKMRSKLN
jgi:ribosomal protein L29